MHICKMRKYASYVTLYIYTHAPYLQNVHIRSQDPATQQDSLIASERQLSILSFALDCVAHQSRRTGSKFTTNVQNLAPIFRELQMRI